MNKFIPVCEPLLAGNELKYVTDAASTGWISSSGPYVSKFEESFSHYCGVKYGVAVTNGTFRALPLSYFPAYYARWHFHSLFPAFVEQYYLKHPFYSYSAYTMRSLPYQVLRQFG